MRGLTHVRGLTYVRRLHGEGRLTSLPLLRIVEELQEGILSRAARMVLLWRNRMRSSIWELQTGVSTGWASRGYSLWRAPLQHHLRTRKVWLIGVHLKGWGTDLDWILSGMDEIGMRDLVVLTKALGRQHHRNSIPILIQISSL